MRRHGLTRVALGFSILASLATSVLGGEYYLSDARLGEKTAPLLLLSRADVQADLGLTPEQTASAEATIDELYTRAESLRGKPNSPEVIAERRAIDTAQAHWIATRLSARQQDRLIQIDLQWEGPAALVTRRVVQEALSLTPEQLRILSQASAAYRRAVHEGHQPGNNGPEHEFAKTTLSTLTAEQQDRWRIMLGKPLDVKVASKPASPAAAAVRR